MALQLSLGKVIYIEIMTRRLWLCVACLMDREKTRGTERERERDTSAMRRNQAFALAPVFAARGQTRGFTLVHLPAQRKHFWWDKRYVRVV